jgi:hypothetical protein
MISRSWIIDAERITSERIHALHRYWRGKCGSAGVPMRSSIDPLEIPRLLPYVALAEIETPFRVRYRLVGTKVAESNGSDFTGRYMDECGFAVEALLRDCYQRLVATRAPVFAYYEWDKPEVRSPIGRIGASETGFFPLTSDGRVIDRAIGLADVDVPPFDPRST